MRPGRPQDDDGSALVEFCFLAVLLLVPVVYLVLTLGRLQAAAFATEGAAREAGRAFVTGTDEASGRERAAAAALIAFSDQGFDDQRLEVIDIECSDDPCLAPDSRVIVRATLQVVLPAVPRLVDRFVPARVRVHATHVATVDRFGAR